MLKSINLYKILIKRNKQAVNRKQPALSSLSSKISGSITVPGDKSVSHRAIMLSSIAKGVSLVSGLLESEDVMATINAFRAMGVNIIKKGPSLYEVEGVGLHGLKKPTHILDMGNSGTSMRLIAGLLCGQKFETTLTGDASLQKRPMQRIIEPLSKQGVVIKAKDENYPPLTVQGIGYTKGGIFRPKVASAQVKSAILLAGLYARQPTVIYEPIPTRDYTEKMLQNLGADIRIESDGNKGHIITLTSGESLKAKNITVPGDISSAAFPMVAAAIVPKSDLTITNVGLHPARNGIIRSLQKMSARIKITNILQTAMGEIGDIHISYTPLKGAFISKKMTASQIDEYPILAIAAACGEGETFMEGLEELKVKESDRLSGIVEGLKANKVKVKKGNDWVKIQGEGQAIYGGGFVETHLDHRMAMAFLIAGTYAQKPIIVDDVSPIETSFPHFIRLMNKIGMNVVEEK